MGNGIIVAAIASRATIALRHPILVNLHMHKSARGHRLVYVSGTIANGLAVSYSSIDRLVSRGTIPSLIEIVLKSHIVHLNESRNALANNVCNAARRRERPLIGNPSR
jgi:hypothetical protein